MIRKPNFTFDGTASVGLDLVPINSPILIEDAGSGIPKYIILTSQNSITNLTTVGTLLTTLQANWEYIQAPIDAPNFTGTVTAFSPDFSGTTNVGAFKVNGGATSTNAMQMNENQINFYNANGDTARIDLGASAEILMGCALGTTEIVGVNINATGLLQSESPIGTLSRVVVSDTTETGTDPVYNIVSCTQAEYNALTPVATTLYYIVG